jgi:hypothetical protein
LLAPAQQLPDQRGADLAPAADHKDQRPPPPAGASACPPTSGTSAELINGESLIGPIRIAD